MSCKKREKKRTEGRRLPPGDTVTYILTASRPPSRPAHLLARPALGACVSHVRILASGFSPRRNLRRRAVQRDRSGDRQTDRAHTMLLCFLSSSCSQFKSFCCVTPAALFIFHLHPGSCVLTQSCPILCGSMDCSPPASCVHGIFQVRKLEWVTISHFRGPF